MLKKILTPLALAAIVASSQASATSIKIDFEEFAWGSSVNGYFNGGKDTLNRSSGPYYGISFFGGKVKHTPRGAYLSGDVSMSLDAAVIRSILGTDRYIITFNAARFDIDGGGVGVTYENGFNEFSIYMGGNGNPYCGRPEYPDACNSPHYSFMGGYLLAYTGDLMPNGVPALVTSIGFNSDRLDNIEIIGLDSFAQTQEDLEYLRPASIPGSQETGRDIPEPGSIALIAAGLAGLFGMRRRRSVSKPAE